MKWVNEGEGREAYIFDEAHEQILRARQANGYEMMHAILAGDEKAVMEYLEAAMDSIYEVNRRYSPQEANLRQMNNRLVSLNTVFSMCAGYAHVPSVFLHCILRYFDRRIIQLTELTQEPALQREMAETYCAFIRNAQSEYYGEFSQQIIDLLLADLTSIPKLEDLAQKMHMAPATISRHFKAETGQTIPEFVNRSRIRLAKLYMQEGGDLSQVAYEVGFCDASYFSKVFYRYEGMTPTGYLTQYRNQIPT